MNILGTKVDNLTKQEILEKVNFFLSDPKFHQIATINPEFILEAQKNAEFREILNNCDLNIADGIGIKFAFWRYGKHLKCRMAGVDLMNEIIKIANDRELSIFLAANKGGLSTWEETRDAILRKYPDLSVNGANLDRNITTRSFANVQDDKKYVEDILFVNFGAPYQELFINNVKCDNIRLAIGVGGSFDFLTGKAKRAPDFMQKLGLEWLWRFLRQPKRWKRIWNAVIIFPVKILCSKEK